MTQHASQRLVRGMALGFAALPVGFGALRALTTGTDFRYLVTALASLATAATVFGLGASRASSRWLLSAAAVAVSTVVGGIVAFAQGARSPAAVWTVACAFGLCFAMSGLLGLFSRPAA